MMLWTRRAYGLGRRKHVIQQGFKGLSAVFLITVCLLHQCLISGFK